jgi:hypothetical protein
MSREGEIRAVKGRQSDRALLVHALIALSRLGVIGVSDSRGPMPSGSPPGRGHCRQEMIYGLQAIDALTNDIHREHDGYP